MKSDSCGVNVFIRGNKCYRCSHVWVPRNIKEIPEICPKCKSPYWNKVKKNNKGSASK